MITIEGITTRRESKRESKILTQINKVITVFPKDVGTTIKEFLYNVFCNTVF